MCEQNVIRLIYFESNVNDMDRIQQLGLSNRLELEDAKIHALQSLYRLYIKDREQYEGEFRIMLLDEQKQSNKL